MILSSFHFTSYIFFVVIVFFIDVMIVAVDLDFLIFFFHLSVKCIDFLSIFRYLNYIFRAGMKAHIYTHTHTHAYTLANNVSLSCFVLLKTFFLLSFSTRFSFLVLHNVFSFCFLFFISFSLSLSRYSIWIRTKFESNKGGKSK